MTCENCISGILSNSKFPWSTECLW
jgi:hypothetical protein